MTRPTTTGAGALTPVPVSTVRFLLTTSAGTRTIKRFGELSNKLPG